MTRPTWSTACLDWEDRIIRGRSLVPFAPLFPEEAEAALQVFKALPIVDLPFVEDGYGGMRPQTFGEACRQWVFDFVGAIFGSYDRATGEQLINEFFELIPKKNIKSTMAAGIMVTALVRNWRMRNELTILAPTIKVAENSAGPAMAMVRWNSELASLLRPVEHKRLLEHRVTKAELRILAADTETTAGSKAGFVLVDEHWLFGKMLTADSMLREATGGLASKPEGFVIKLATQSNDPPAGVFKADLQRFRDIRDGKIEAPNSLGIIYEFPRAMVKAKAYENPENFGLVNPNMGASVRTEFLVAEQDKARQKGPGPLADFYAKHLNVEIGLALRSDRWAGADYWAAAEEATLVDLDYLLSACDVVVSGIDGGGLDDLLGLAFLGRERVTRRWLLWVHCWAHRIVLERRKDIATELLGFEEDGDLTICEEPDQDVIGVADLIEKAFRQDLFPEKNAIGVDTVGIGQIVDEIVAREIPQELIVGVSQGWKLTGAIKSAERGVKDRTLVHAKQPIMNWAVSNAKVEPRGNAITITKQAAGSMKIDPLMATFNAVALMCMNPEAKRSTYEDRPMLII